MAQQYTERGISATKLVAVFSVTILLFVSGLLVGQFISDQRSQKILSTNQQLTLELSDLEIQSELLQTYPCNDYLFYSLGEKIDDLGNSILTLENQLGKQDKRVLELKRPYTLLLIRDYLLIKERTKECGKDYVNILFFYSNKPEYIQESEKQGYVLSYFANKYGYNRVKVFPLDVDVNLGSLESLRAQYNSSYLPTTVINDLVFAGFHEKEELEVFFQEPTA